MNIKRLALNNINLKTTFQGETIIDCHNGIDNEEEFFEFKTTTGKKIIICLAGVIIGKNLEIEK